MRKLFYTALCLLFLTGCPNQKEIREMMDTLQEQKAVAAKVIDSRDFSVDNLLKAQDFFFGFGEKVHLVKVEEDALKNLKTIVKSDGIKKFCQNFVLPVRQWEVLETYCSSGNFYRCSPDIKEYKNTLNKLLESLGANTAQAFSREPECN